MDNVIQVAKVYYWNCRLQGKTALLAGPFLTAGEAEACADIVSPIAIMQHPEAGNATFGVVEMNAPGLGAGELNNFLPKDMLGNMLLLADNVEGKQ